MRILHIHPSLSSGGIEAMICNLANEMVERNDVTVCSIYQFNDNDVFRFKLNTNVHVTSLHKQKPGMNIKILWQIYGYIKKGHFDIVHIHGFFYYYFIAILLLHKKCQFFYTIHSDASMENSNWDIKLINLKKYFFKFNWMHPITISKASQKTFFKLYKCKSTLIYNGTVNPSFQVVDLSKYKITSETKILFHPGRISLAKNQVMLCETCLRLINEGYDFVLLIAGSKQETQIFSKLSTFFSNRIIYLGERNDVIGIMASSDAFCLSSLWEGMPVTLLEALSVGCIPICTPVGGIPEVIDDGFSGFLSISSNADDYYVALKKYLDTPETDLQKIKQNVHLKFKSFDVSQTALVYEKEYLKQLKN